MKKYLFTLILLSFFFATSSQDKGSLSGYIKNSKGQFLEGISEVLKEINLSTITRSDGSFSLAVLPAGNYTIVVRGVGYKEEIQEQVITDEAPALVLSFTLQEKANALQEVEVLGRKETTYKSEYSFIGTKIASQVIDMLQTISTVTKELIEDQQAFTLNEVVKNVAGVNQ